MTTYETPGRLACALCLMLAVAACGGDTTASGEGGSDAEAHLHGADCDHDAEAAGPHGGALANVGTSAARLEALHDDVLGQVTIYIIDETNGMLTLDAPPMLNMVTDEGSVQVQATAVGGAWVFESDDLLDEPEKARIRLVLAGKTWTVDMPCSHDHGDEHAGHDHAEGEGHDDDHDGHEHEEGDGHDDDHGHEDGDHDSP